MQTTKVILLLKTVHQLTLNPPNLACSTRIACPHCLLSSCISNHQHSSHTLPGLYFQDILTSFLVPLRCHSPSCHVPLPMLLSLPKTLGIASLGNLVHLVILILQFIAHIIISLEKPSSETRLDPLF